MNLLSATLAEPQSFSPWEKLLLVALIVASGVLFWRRFGPILKRILRSKKDPNFSLSPIGKRVWDFFWEVLCQAKVIRERPLPGLAHAFVFWGFCAFALVTLNHLRVGLGLGFLDPTGSDRALLLLLRRSLCHRLRRRHLRPFRPPLLGAPPLARRQSSPMNPASSRC